MPADTAAKRKAEVEKIKNQLKLGNLYKPTMQNIKKGGMLDMDIGELHGTGWDYFGAVMANIPIALDKEVNQKALNSSGRVLANAIRRNARYAFDYDGSRRRIEDAKRGKDEPKRKYTVGRGKRQKTVTVGYGEMYKSIRSRQGLPQFNPSTLVSVGNIGARQVFLLEFGHGGPKPAPPHPFVIPAFLGANIEMIHQYRNTVLTNWEKIKGEAISMARSETRRGRR